MIEKEKCFREEISFDANDKNILYVIPAIDFSVSICNIPKFICSSYGGVSRLLITGNVTRLIKVTFTET